MNKILKLSGVSMLAIVAATGANAAGYTCEELIEYTSCNAGYYLGNCPDGYTYGVSWCYDDAELDPDWECNDDYCPSEEERRISCNDFGPFYGVGCFRNDVISDLNENWDESPYYQLELEELPDGAFISGGTSSCNECLAGHSCPGGDKDSATISPCAAGTYQPNKKQTSCISAPVGNYVAGTGATTYTACAMGSYQPTAGQESCLTCPAGSYCATTGLSAVSGQCNKGTYSVGGATSANCTACPSTGLTDKDGATVVATTPTTGSTSLLQCVVGEEYYFTDTKGTYHYTSDCAVKLWQVSLEEFGGCEAIATLETNGIVWLEDFDDFDCTAPIDDGINQFGAVTSFAPKTEVECNALNESNSQAPTEYSRSTLRWENGSCSCSGHYWIFDENGLGCIDI